MMMNPTHTRRTGVAGSPRTAIPQSTVPTAPIPVQTAYAVPMGSDLAAIPSSPTLMTNAIMVPTLGHKRVNPSVNFRPMAHVISNKAAMIRIIHDILNHLVARVVPDLYVNALRSSSMQAK